MPKKNNSKPEEVVEKKDKNWRKQNYVGGSPGMIYGLGLLGSAIFYIQNANSFGEGFVGILKAIVWPAFVVYRLHEFLKLQ